MDQDTRDGIFAIVGGAVVGSIQWARSRWDARAARANAVAARENHQAEEHREIVALLERIGRLEHRVESLMEDLSIRDSRIKALEQQVRDLQAERDELGWGKRGEDLASKVAGAKEAGESEGADKK